MSASDLSILFGRVSSLAHRLLLVTGGRLATDDNAGSHDSQREVHIMSIYTPYI